MRFSGIVVDCHKVILSYIVFFYCFGYTFECAIHTSTVITPENIGSYHPIAKWRENVSVFVLEYVFPPKILD